MHFFVQFLFSFYCNTHFIIHFLSPLYFSFFFFFYFIFKLYIIVLVLPNIKMNLPQVYMMGNTCILCIFLIHSSWFALQVYCFLHIFKNIIPFKNLSLIHAFINFCFSFFPFLIHLCFFFFYNFPSFLLPPCHLFWFCNLLFFIFPIFLLKVTSSVLYLWYFHYCLIFVLALL